MDIEDFLILSPLIKGLHKYSHDICELFWDVKMEIYIFGNTKNNIYKTVSIFKNN